MVNFNAMRIIINVHNSEIDHDDRVIIGTSLTTYTIMRSTMTIVSSLVPGLQLTQ